MTLTSIGLAAVGDWSVGVPRRDDPASLPLALPACALLTLALTALTRALVRHARALVYAAWAARRLPLVDPADYLGVLDDPVPDDYALPGAPGRIVVSTGMLEALDTSERQVLLAHERAHLACRHHLFVTLADLTAATNPLLLPVAAAVRYSTERWADEHAAHATGDRRLVARTIGKAAVLPPSAPQRSVRRVGLHPRVAGLTNGVAGRLRPGHAAYC